MSIHSPDYLAQNKALYQEHLYSRYGPPSGYSEEELETLEDEIGSGLPLAYRQFLGWAGKMQLCFPLQGETPQLGSTATLPAYWQHPRFPTDCLFLRKDIAWFFLPAKELDPWIYVNWPDGPRQVGRLTNCLEKAIRLSVNGGRIRREGIVFQDEIIGVTPYDLESTVLFSHVLTLSTDLATPQTIADTIRLQGGMVGDFGIWQHNQVIVIGKERFDKSYLKQSVKIGQQQGFVCHYITADDFENYRRYGVLPHYTSKRQVKDHPGLRYLTSIGFDWPSVDPQIGKLGKGIDPNFREAHPLRKTYGYHVNRPYNERRAILQQAIQENELGLRAVAEHIARQIRLRHTQESMENAIAVWKMDLAWLKARYYDSSHHSFRWPNSVSD